MKILVLVLQFYSNMVATGAEYANKILQETSLLFFLQHLIETKLLEKL